MKKMQKNITIILAGVSILFACTSQTTKQKLAPTTIQKIPVTTDTLKNWVQLQDSSRTIIIDQRYASTNNFMHKQIYPCSKMYVRPEVATALYQAATIAHAHNVQLVIYDAYRPQKFQKIMYDIVQNPTYVALPSKGSMHNKGLAVDIALADSNGTVLDFGSSFDDFTTKANYSYNHCSTNQKNNRALLRTMMTQVGFSPYEKEWWHFNYTKVNYPTDAFIWNCNE